MDARPLRLHRSWLLAASLLVVMPALLACEEPPPPLPEGPRPVKMTRIVAGGEGTTREYPGRIKAGQYSEMGFEVDGRVTEFIFKEGAAVDDGAILAKLDPRDYQARFDSALAKQEHARSERDRYKIMYEKDVKPWSEYEMRMRMFDVKAAETREAQKALDDTTLRAPFKGVMARKLVEEFENVLAKEPVLVMQNDQLLEIKVSVPERDLAHGRRDRSRSELNARLAPVVTITSLPDSAYPARLKELANVADPVTRTFEATFVFPRPEDQGVNILGGMTAKVVISVPEEFAFQGSLIPATAVVAGEGGDGAVWVIDEQSMVASKRDVKLGEMTDVRVEVREGLSPGELIALSGVHQLRDGMVVTRYER